MATVSDRVLPEAVTGTPTAVRGYTADIVTASDYYPFGMVSRAFNSPSVNYRYGFNGQEVDNEIAGIGNSLHAEFWQYDPRVGRRWNLDPKPTVGISEYAAFNNSPIFFSDPRGDTVKPGAGFWVNAWEGIKEGGRDTKNFIRSLGTTEGWKNMGEGMHTMLSPDALSMMKRGEMAGNVIEGAKNIPNMNADEWGHAVGYGTEKIAESVLLSKGAGLASKGASLLLSGRQTSKLSSLLNAANGESRLVGFGSDAAIAENSANLLPKRGWYDIVIHGTEDGLGFTMDGVRLTPQQLYSNMLTNGYQQGTRIRLMSCYTGSLSDGAAYQLSQLANAPVVAPTNSMWIANGQGFLPAGKLMVENGGWFKVFK